MKGVGSERSKGSEISFVDLSCRPCDGSSPSSGHHDSRLSHEPPCKVSSSPQEYNDLPCCVLLFDPPGETLRQQALTTAHLMQTRRPWAKTTSARFLMVSMEWKTACLLSGKREW